MSFHLQILIGHDRGSAISIEEGGRYVVGRSSDLDIVLKTDAVSRRHALVRGISGGLLVSDERSTHGTFVNGRRVKGEARMGPGDILNIGDFIFRGGACEPLVVHPGLFLDSRYRPETGPRNAVCHFFFRGSLEHLPLPSLLRHLTFLKKTGALVLTKPGQGAWVALEKGQIAEVCLEDVIQTDRHEALRSLFAWAGDFDLEPPRDRKPSEAASPLIAYDDVLPAIGSEAPSLVGPQRR